MASSFEKSVKGGTKIKLAAPKSKYVEHILIATHAGDAGVGELFRTLQFRLRDSTWTIVFKALIIVHLMIREGEPNVTLRFLADAPSKLDVGNFSEVQVQGANIRHYSAYLLARVKAFRDTKMDWVREGQGRLKRQTIDKGLLRETESVQNQIAALLKCDLLSNEPENEISLTAFRLLTMDLLILYHVMNEGTINVLEHYFEMSKYDAERALAIYKTFSKQTDKVVGFLSVARQHETATRLEIPKLKHAPTSLTASLEEYLNDPDFEINRRQYLAQQEAKRTGKPMPSNRAKELSEDSKKPNLNGTSGSSALGAGTTSQVTASKSEPKGPAPDLIDFFDSIENNQRPLAALPQQQVPNFQAVPQYQFQSNYNNQPNFQPGQPQLQQQADGTFNNSNPFGQIGNQSSNLPDFTGVGYNNYPQQTQQPFNGNQTGLASIPQNDIINFAPEQQDFAPQQQPNPPALQPQSTNPFRQSMMAQPTTSSSPSFNSSAPSATSLNRQSTNPFTRSINVQATGQSQNSAFTPQTPQSTFSSISTPFTSTSSPFFSPPPQQSSQSFSQVQPPPQPLQPARTGTNPFTRSQPNSQSHTPITSPVISNPTGSTNPFRQSAFVNQQTGQGWQASQGTFGGGFDQLETIPVFPRPGQSQQQQQTQAWP